MAWQNKGGGAAAPVACNLTPNWMLDCTLFTWGAFNVALPRAMAAPGITPPLHPPDTFPWPITASLHLNRELYARISSLPVEALAGVPINEVPQGVIQTVMSMRKLDKVSMAQGEQNERSWGAHAAKRAAFFHQGTNGEGWLEDFLVVARSDAGAIILAILIPQPEIPKLAYLQYLVHRSLHWDPQGYTPATPMQIPPSIYFEPTAIPTLSQAAIQQKAARVAAMAQEAPPATAAMAQVFADLIHRPVVEWDAAVPQDWWQRLQAAGQHLRGPNAQGLWANHLQHVRTGRDLQGLAMVWATA